MAYRSLGLAVTFWIVVLLAQAASAQVNPEPAIASVGCGLSEIATGDRVDFGEIPSVPLNDFEELGLPIVVQTMGVFGPQTFECEASAIPNALCPQPPLPCPPPYPSYPVGVANLTTAGVSHNGTVVASSAVNIGMQFTIKATAGPTGPPRMVPFVIQVGGSVFVDPTSHVGTLAETRIIAPLRLEAPFDFVPLNVVGGQATFRSLGHVESIFTNQCCQVRDNVSQGCAPLDTLYCSGGTQDGQQCISDTSCGGGLCDDTTCPFSDFVEGVAEEAVLHQFQLTAAIGTFGLQPQSGNAEAEAIIDPTFSIDPEAEFAPGMRYADFYTITVSPNVTVPEPGQAPQLLAAVTALCALASMRRRANRPGAS
jgi:hypothetical protein